MKNKTAQHTPEWFASQADDTTEEWEIYISGTETIVASGLNKTNAALIAAAPETARERNELIVAIKAEEATSQYHYQQWVKAEKQRRKLAVAIKDHLQWMQDGKVDGVSFDEKSAKEALRAAIAKAS